MHHTTDRIGYNTAFVTPVVDHWLEQEIAQCVHHEGSIKQPVTPQVDALPQSYVRFLRSDILYYKSYDGILNSNRIFIHIYF